MKIINDLKRYINKKKSLKENLFLFYQICQKYYNLEETFMVFETINIPYNGSSYFSLSVSLQVQNCSVPYQIRLNINYAHQYALDSFNEVIWSDEVNNFLASIIELPSYHYISEQQLIPVSIDILHVVM